MEMACLPEGNCPCFEIRSIVSIIHIPDPLWRRCFVYPGSLVSTQLCQASYCGNSTSGYSRKGLLILHRPRCRADV